MAGKRKAPLWRQVFLRALKRTGNVRASACEAVDPGTAYDHRAKDADFAVKWDAMLGAYRKRPPPRPRSRLPDGNRPAGGRGRKGGEELVLRRTKHGDRLVRAAPGRWSARIEESFLDGLEHTGCVEAAAAAAGLSTKAFYKRRDAYPEFRSRWEERLARFGAQLPGLLNAAAVQSLRQQPEGAKRRGRARLPQVNVAEAIRIAGMNEKRQGGGTRRNLVRKPEQSHEELTETFVKLLGMMKRRRAQERRAAGWTDAGNGIWLPPGWTVQRPEDPPPAEG